MFIDSFTDELVKLSSTGEVRFEESGSEDGVRTFKAYNGDKLVGIARVDVSNRPNGHFRRRDWPRIDVSPVGKPCFAQRGIARSLRDKLEREG